MSKEEYKYIFFKIYLSTAGTVRSFLTFRRIFVLFSLINLHKMEPMTLGSPGGSPACANNSQYLPSFLMAGSDSSYASPRNNTMSPVGGRANLNFSGEFL